MPFELPVAGEPGVLYASRDSKFSLPVSRIIPGFASPLTHLAGDELDRLRRVAAYREDDVVDLGQLTGEWAHEILHDAIEEYIDAYTRALKNQNLL